TTSPHAKSLAPVIRPLVMLNHSIRRLFDTISRYQAFVMGSPALYQSVLPKFAAPMAPAEPGSSKIPDTLVMPPVHQIAWTPEEQVYINHIFMLNEAIHQHLIGGVDCPDEVCLYKAFRKAPASKNQSLQLYARLGKTQPGSEASKRISRQIVDAIG